MGILNSLKGWLGEAGGSFAQWLWLDDGIYKSINNLTVETNNGTTQIDHVIVSRFGIFVVEDKNMAGWIFGNPNDSQWTVMNHGQKYRIQNPLHQNYRHIRAIMDILEIGMDRVHSLVVFCGESTFKTEMPDNVMSRGYISYIKGFRKILFTDDQVSQMYDALQSKALRKSWTTKMAHIESLRDRYSSNTICPKCGSKLVLRTAGKGPNRGNQFYACSRYPRCHYTKNLDDE